MAATLASKILKREALPVPVSTSPNDDLVDFRELAQKASNLLGYGLLSSKHHADTESISFAKVLSELGIKPFSEDSVRAYKAKMEWKAKPIFERIVSIASTALRYMLFGGLTGIFIFSLLFVSSMILFAEASSWAAVSFICFFGFSIVSLALKFMAMAWLEENSISFSWRGTRLDNYRERVPEFALQTAVDVKERFPDVEICVEWLGYDVVIGDPFLCATFGRKTYYLEVWNEPGFKGKREV